MNIAKNSKGFTLVEIVIVIAIAALILAALLIFVPQAQNAQKDGQRRSAASQILSKISEFAGNNQGAYPPGTGTWGAFQTGYLAPIMIDNSTSASTCTQAASAPTSLTPSTCEILISGQSADVYVGLTNSVVFDAKNH